MDMPSAHPIYETELIKGYMRDALERYEGYAPYMDALREMRRKHPEIGLHLVLYPDVIQAIGLEQLRAFVDENRIASIMVAGGDPQVLASLRQVGITTIERIECDMQDEQLRVLSRYPETQYLNFNYKRHAELQPHGCVSFKEKIAYIRKSGVRARILAVEGIANGQMMREVREAGANGALLGNALMRLWDDEGALWALFDEFQAAAQL